MKKIIAVLFLSMIGCNLTPNERKAGADAGSDYHSNNNSASTEPYVLPNAVPESKGSDDNQACRACVAKNCTDESRMCVQIPNCLSGVRCIAGCVGKVIAAGRGTAESNLCFPSCERAAGPGATAGAVNAIRCMSDNCFNECFAVK